MAKKSNASAPEGPIEGVLAVRDGQLVIVGADRNPVSLDSIADQGNGAVNAKLTLVVDLSRSVQKASDDRAGLLSTICALQRFLGDRAVGALDGGATCVVNPPAQPATKKPAPSPKPPKPPKPPKSRKD